MPEKNLPTSGIDDAVLRETARRLYEAEKTRTPIPQLSLQYPAMTIEDAYAVQRALTDLKVADGRTVRGRKIGLTSKVMQRNAGITEPDYGVLFDDMFVDDGGVVAARRFIQPRIEVELAFILGEDLSGPGVTLYDVLRASEYVTPALEILDSRVQMTDPATGHRRTIVDTIADNAADAGIVLGGRVVRPLDIDLRWVSALLLRNAAIEESGVAAAVLGHPAHGVAWLANRLAPHGVSLKAGEVILAGSFTTPIFAEPGDTFVADYGPLGTVSCTFAKEED
ncbi:2-oxo-hept-4-ene-1,7-dioate hydratase [Tomitella biformata]|uniref:2-oxo-hept-4-ene-1,7-dioate hydratase n=1 Tax=Tomitella biformata TaxID=630403 RepID=UPI0004638928|nr:2-oxo-hepta-3-ene-1,7-dioic acid hydratase [Tomitella biformata]